MLVFVNSAFKTSCDEWYVGKPSLSLEVTTETHVECIVTRVGNENNLQLIIFAGCLHECVHVDTCTLIIYKSSKDI